MVTNAFYARGGGPSGTATKLLNPAIWGIGDCVAGGGASVLAASGSTAIGPSSETTVRLPGSGEVPRQLQPDGDFAGWCIGHVALAVWMQVQPGASAACRAIEHMDTGTAASAATCADSQRHASQRRRLRTPAMFSAL